MAFNYGVLDASRAHADGQALALTPLFEARMVTLPPATAVKTGGSSAESDTTYLLVHKDVHVSTGTCSAQVTVLDDAGWTLLRLARNGQIGSLVIIRLTT